MRTTTLVTVMGLALMATGCTQNLDMNKAKAAIGAGITEKIGLTSTVTCPETREVKAADTFECTADITGGAKLTVKVTQKDGEGNIEWEVAKTERLLDLAVVEASVKTGLLEQVQLDAVVSCGGAKYRSAEPGKTFDCSAKSADQQVAIVVTMTDDQGNISWETSDK